MLTLVLLTDVKALKFHATKCLNKNKEIPDIPNLFSTILNIKIISDPDPVFVREAAKKFFY